MQRVIGFVIIFGIVFGGFVWLGGSPMQIIKPVDIMIIVGGGFVAMVIGCSSQTLRLMTRQAKLGFSKSIYTKEYYTQLLNLLFELINVAREKSVIDLDKHVEAPDKSTIFKKYTLITEDEVTFRYVVDALRLAILMKANAKTAGVLEQNLDEEIDDLEAQYSEPGDKLATMADSLPGLGIMCAIMALVLVMGKLDQDIFIIGSSIAGALVGTLTGVLFCYILFLPIASSVSGVAASQVVPLMCIRSAVVQYARGGSAHLCANAARKHIPIELKPTFEELEQETKILKDLFDNTQ